MDGDLEKRKANIEHLKKVIAASQKLGIGMVTTFIGRDHTKSVEENLKLLRKSGRILSRFAEEHQVRVAIENCPMLLTRHSGRGGQNPQRHRKSGAECSEIIPSGNFGLNYDPSHFVWQMMDYIKPMYEFRDRIFHVHYKDIKLYKDRLDNVGTMAYPLEYMAPKLPGLGDVDWAKYVSALTDIGYNGYTCIEVEDKALREHMKM